MRRLLVLGGGTAGTMIVNKLHRRLAREDWQITVVDRDDDHLYQPGYLFLPFGAYMPDQVVRKRHGFIPDGVDLILAEIDRVDAEDNTVLLADGRVLPYDYLVIAIGTAPRPDQTPGMLGGAVAQERVRLLLPRGVHGAGPRDELLRPRASRHPHHRDAHQVPGRTLEFAFLTEAWLRERGIRDRVELVYVTPPSGAFTRPIASQRLGDMLIDRKIPRNDGTFAEPLHGA